MKSIRLVTAVSLALMLSGGAFAQSAPATPTAPAASTATATAPAAVDKKAIAKQCIDAANQKGLHGKARKHFKSQCKKGKV